MSPKPVCLLERSATSIEIMCHPERSTEGTQSKDLLFAMWAAILFFIMATYTHAQTAPSGEQFETGQKETAHGTRDYKIRMLPLSSFPGLPSTIVSGLNEQHCLIPQTFEARRPENVIHGEFEKRGSSDWAMLCSHDGSTKLLVFFSGAFDKPTTLAEWKDTDRMSSEKPSDDLGSAWGINTIPPDGMAHTPSVHRHGPFDHDGIEDDYLEHSSIVHYYRNGNWLALEGNN